MKKDQTPATEKRSNSGEIELREEGKKRTLVGYAAVFGKRSQNFGSDQEPFYEIIQRGAFSEALKGDVRALVNHDSNGLLGRTKNGTLRLSEDETGLRYELDLPDTQLGRDIHESIKRGDMDQSSFGFRVRSTGQKFEVIDEGGKEVVIRTVTKIDELLDVSPVTYPAYEETRVEARSFEEFKKQREKETLAEERKIEEAARARRIRLLELA